MRNNKKASGIKGLLNSIGIVELPDEKGKLKDGLVSSKGNIKVNGLLKLIGIDELPVVFYLKLTKMADDDLSNIITKLPKESAGLSKIIKQIQFLKNEGKKTDYLNKTFGYITSKTEDKDFIKNTKEEVKKYGLQEAAREVALEQKDWKEVLKSWHAVEERFTGTESKESLFDQIEKSAFDTIEKQKFQGILDDIGVDQEKNRQLLNSAQNIIESTKERSRRLLNLRTAWRGIEDSVSQKDKEDFNKLLSDHIGNILNVKKLSKEFNIDEPLEKAEALVAAKKEWHKYPKRNTVIDQWTAVRREASEAETKDYERLIHDHAGGLASASKVGEIKNASYAKFLADNDPLEIVMRIVITPIQDRLKPLQDELTIEKAKLKQAVDLFNQKKTTIEEIKVQIAGLPNKEENIIGLQLDACIRRAPRLIGDAEETIGKPDSNTVNGLEEQINDVSSKTKEVGKLVKKIDETRQKIIQNTTVEETKPDPVPAPVTTQPAPLQTSNQGVNGGNTAQSVKLTPMAETRTKMLGDLETLISATNERANKYGAQVISWGSKNTRKKDAVKKVLEAAKTMETMLTSLASDDPKININQVTRAIKELSAQFNKFRETTVTSSFGFFGTGSATKNDQSYIEKTDKILNDSNRRVENLIVSEGVAVCGM